MASSRTRSNYRPTEVQALVKEFQKTKEKIDTTPSRIHDLCRLLDIEAAISRLGPHEYQAVLLCGQLDLDFRTAASLMGCATDTMNQRYKRALEMLLTDLNHVGGP